MLFDEFCKRFVTALLSLEHPGVFVTHLRSLYFLYAGSEKKLHFSGLATTAPFLDADLILPLFGHHAFCPSPEQTQYTSAQGNKKALKI